MSSENIRIAALEEKIDKLQELIFRRILYPNCLHYDDARSCTNHEKDVKDCQCSKENCPLFDNPWDI